MGLLDTAKTIAEEKNDAAKQYDDDRRAKFIKEAVELTEKHTGFPAEYERIVTFEYMQMNSGRWYHRQTNMAELTIDDVTVVYGTLERNGSTPYAYLIRDCPTGCGHRMASRAIYRVGKDSDERQRDKFLEAIADFFHRRKLRCTFCEANAPDDCPTCQRPWR